MKKGEGWYWVFGIIGAIVLLVGLYFHSQRMQDCDEKGGVLVRSGTSNVCVKQLP